MRAIDADELIDALAAYKRQAEIIGIIPSIDIYSAIALVQDMPTIDKEAEHE